MFYLINFPAAPKRKRKQSGDAAADGVRKRVRRPPAAAAAHTPVLVATNALADAAAEEFFAEGIIMDVFNTIVDMLGPKSTYEKCQLRSVCKWFLFCMELRSDDDDMSRTILLNTYSQSYDIDGLDPDELFPLLEAGALSHRGHKPATFMAILNSTRAPVNGTETEAQVLTRLEDRYTRLATGHEQGRHAHRGRRPCLHSNVARARPHARVQSPWL